MAASETSVFIEIADVSTLAQSRMNVMSPISMICGSGEDETGKPG
jgi:hypothetical protein